MWFSTTIRLLFAVAEPIAVTGSQAPALREPLASLDFSGHILVVDDEQSVARFLSELLEARGYHVTYLTSRRAALTIFNAEPNGFDLVLTDRTMPEMSGVELAEALHLKHPDLPVILCSGYSETLEEEVARAHGIRGFITKPIDIPVLLGLVKELLDEDGSADNLIGGAARSPSIERPRAFRP